jgi:toxin-antitoxin system PIN domain toxin
MIFPDVNLLLYAYNTESAAYKKAAAWLQGVMNSNERLCHSWHTIMGFIRISTNSRIFPKPYSAKEALEIVSSLINAKNSTMLLPGSGHFAIFEKLVNESGINGPKLMDAHIAALAIEHGATLASADRDFRLFDGLKIINPLTS